MGDFEQLGFDLSVGDKGYDTAISRLDAIIKRLEKIQGLEKGVGGGDGKRPSKASKKHFEYFSETGRLDKHDKSVASSNAQRRAYEQLKRQVTYEQQLNYIWTEQIQTLTQLNRLKSQKMVYDILGNDPSAMQANLEAQISKINAQVALAQGMVASPEGAEAIGRKAVADEQVRQIKQQALVNAGLREEKVVLSELEKYTQSNAEKTKMLNDEKYIEQRRIELANRQKQKEIDLRLQNELGIKKEGKSLTHYIAKLGSAVVIARQFANFAAKAIEESASYIENLNLFAVAFGDTYEETLTWALDLAKGFGLANNEVVKFAGTFRQLATSLGIADDTADSLAQTVTELGYDFSALFNTSVESAMEKLQSSIFSGNVRPLRAYGIDISQNQINELFETNEALASLGVSANSLSQSEKVLARLIITMQSGSNAFGTMTREINTLQSQIRILQGSWQNFQLAIGDLIQKPLKDTITLINGFLIAITNIIRVFHPINTQDENVISQIGNSASEANEEMDELNGRLATFDKFNVLQKSDSSASTQQITDALTAELEKQQEIYKATVASFDEINNSAIAVADSITEFFLKFDEEGNPLPEFTASAKTLATAIKLLAAVLAGNLITSIIKAVSSLGALNAGFLSLNNLLIGGVVFAFIEMIKAIKEGDTATAIIAGTIGVGLVAALIAFNIAQKRATLGVSLANKAVMENNALLLANSAATLKSAASIQTLGLAIGGVVALIGGITTFINAFDELGTVWKWLIPIASVLLGILTAFVVVTKIAVGNWAAALSAAGIVTGTALAVGATVAQGFAEGGYTNANLIMTHENGTREWVGKAAGSSAIVNDTQMSDIMEGAVAKGVYKAMYANETANNKPTNNTVVVKIGEEEVFTAISKAAKRRGYMFSKI